MVRTSGPETVLRHLAPQATDRTVTLLPFSEPYVRALIHEAKFHGNERAWEHLALALSAYLKHRAAGAIVLPVPLSARRLRRRGYNQSYEIARRAVAGLPHLALRRDVLVRTRDTAPQTSLRRAARLDNMAGAFGARRLHDLTGKHVIILDDVLTTGATLAAAEAALAAACPGSITLLALAH